VIRSVALLAFVLVVAGCGSGSKSSGGSGCKDVPVGMNNEIASFLESGYTVADLQAVKSSGKNVWFVSAHVADPSGLVIYPTWATKDLSNTGRVYRVDAASRRTTPRMSKLAGVSATDNGATAAQDCARNASGKGS
jgi:hypothetical protein